MTLRLIEGWDHFSDYVLKGYIRVGPTGTAAREQTGTFAPGRLGGRAMNISCQADGDIGAFQVDFSVYKMFGGATYNEMIFGFAIRTDANFLQSNRGTVSFFSAGGARIASFIIEVTSRTPGIGPFGVLPGGIVFSTTPHTNGVWTYYEMRLKVNGAAGEIELRRNGGPDIPTTTYNAGTTPIGGIEFNTHSIGQDQIRNYHLDDIYCLSTDGPAPWNTFLGDVRVETLFPTGEGADSDFTPLSGTDNALMVDEVIPDDDTTYNSGTAVGQRDLYVMSNLQTITGQVLGVQASLKAKKDTSGTRILGVSERQGGTTFDGAAFATLGTSYNHHLEPIRHLDPNGNPWTIAGVNASEWGVKVTS